MFDMWYGDSPRDADKVTILFYPNIGEYRGNILKDGRIIGDYSAKSWEKVEKMFPQLYFNWGD